MVLWPHRMAIALALAMVSVVAVVATSEAIVSRGERFILEVFYKLQLQ